MDRIDWDTVTKVYHRARRADPEERSRVLDRSCADDPALRQLVGSLLEMPAGDAAAPPGGEAAPADPTPAAGDRIGPYLVLRRLGSGGMGSVYLAVRVDGEYLRRVAVKVLPPALDSARWRDALRRERQILAGLEHPGIARLYDGGTLPSGSPYLALEYVEGEPIEEFCDRRRLTVAERVELVRKVCEAVDFAHRNLVVHRDLKSSNILVTPAGQPKLLDFGIAKLLDDGDRTLTLREERPLTPAWASPEQLLGRPVTTASDVFSLGVLLYRLLAGCSPHPVRLGERLAAISAAQLAPAASRAVRGAASPEAPEARRAALRRSTHRGLVRTLQGDLDRIAARALHPEVGRRYAGAARLADDLDRWRRHLPVVARRGSALYRLRRFVRRRRWEVAAAATTLALAAAAGINALHQARRTAAEGERARQTTQFMLDLFETSNPRDPLGLTARDLLDLGSQRAAAERTGDARVRADLLRTVGAAYRRLGLWDEAAAALDLSRRTLNELPSMRRDELAPTLHELAALALARGAYGEAETLALEALERRRRGDREGRAADLHLLGWIADGHGDLHLAEERMRAALDLRRTAFGDHHRSTGESWADLSDVLARRGKLDEAQRLAHTGLAALRAGLGPRHPEVAASLSTLAGLERRRGDAAAASRAAREAISIYRRFLPDTHPEVLGARNKLAMAALSLGEDAVAIEQFRAIVAARRALLADDQPNLATALNNLALALSRTPENAAEASALLAEARQIRLRVLGPDHPLTVQSAYAMATLAHRAGRLDEAEELYRQCIEAVSLDRGPAEAGFPYAAYANLLVESARGREAEPIARRALAHLESTYPADHWRVAWAQSALGAALAQQGRLAEGEPLLLAAQRTLVDRLGSDHRHSRAAAARLAALYAEVGGGAAAADVPTAPTPG